MNEYSVRFINKNLSLPTGSAVLVIGGNYRKNEIRRVTNITMYGDGTVYSTTTTSSSLARTWNNWGVYTELQVPLLPKAWLPRGVRGVQGDISFRYSGSNTYKRSPNPPTLALRADLAGGLALRAAYTVAYLPPTVEQALDTVADRPPNQTTIRDPRRGNEQYTIDYQAAPNPDLLTEVGVTRTVGLMFQRGKKHRVTASIDYVDTDKTNEITSLSTTTALDNELWFPDRVLREEPEPGDPYGVGRVTYIRGGPYNVLGRRSKNWTASLGYRLDGVFGGAWELRGRLFCYESYKTQLLPTAPVVENIENPDASMRLMKYRGTGGTSWSRGNLSVGLDGRYYHSRVLPRGSWANQGSSRISAYWEFDAYVQSDLSKFIPWKSIKELKGQLNISNVFDADYPFYAGATGDVALYGDWRGQTYTLSLTATF